MQELPENSVLDTSSLEQSKPIAASSANGYTTPPNTPPSSSPPSTLKPQHHDLGREYSSEDDDEDDDDVHIEEPIIHSVQAFRAAGPASPAKGIASKPRLVTVPKRIPPKLPSRNPNRARGANGPLVTDASSTSTTQADSMEHSPTKEAQKDPSPTRSSRAGSPSIRSDDDALERRMDEIRLSDEHDREDEEEEVMPRDPWAQARKLRKAQEEPESARQSMPGGW